MKVFDEHFNDIANRVLCNRKIVEVRYLTKEEALEMDWYNRPIAMLLDNGVWIYPSADDEGNDGGALFTTSEANPCIPVMRH
jgi:hypothetical protein